MRATSMASFYRHPPDRGDPASTKVMLHRYISLMDELMRFPADVRHDPEIDAWFDDRQPDLGAIARFWFHRMRDCGSDVREVINDGHPIACVGEAAFAYVDVFRAHVNVGFFLGAELEDPAALLEGSGRRMRHVKVRARTDVNESALLALIEAAYTAVKVRL